MTLELRDTVQQMLDTWQAGPRLSVKETAAAIRKALAAQWPGVKFRLTMSRGTGYGWLDAQWTDGPTSEAFHQFTDMFRDMRFDGMDDGYHPVNRGTVFDSNGTNGSRHFSPEATAWAAEQVAAHPGRWDRDHGYGPDAAVRRLLWQVDLCGFPAETPALPE